jgi:hypothetical protein
LTTLEWSLIRQALLNHSKPRRFSDAFIKDEKLKLDSYREVFRDIFKFIQHKEYLPDHQNGDFNLPLFLRNTTYSESQANEVVKMIKENQVAPLMVG